MANLLFQSKKSIEADYFSISIFTPTYNRRKTLKRTYESIKKIVCPYINNEQISFEWILVDDGSTDGTEALAYIWCNDDTIAMRYYMQENQGKHIAMNFAVKQARGKFFLTIDSDDTLLPNALEIYFNLWDSITCKELYCGVSARCRDEDGNIVGTKIPIDPMDTSFTDLRMKYKINGEMLEMYRTDILRQYPFPTYDKRMRFCPESIVWHEIAKKYKLRITNSFTRTYFHDETCSLINNHNKSRSISNYYLWRYNINNLSDYVWYNPQYILKSFIGISMDGFRIGKTCKDILNECNSFLKKILVFVFMPLGKILSLQ